MEFERLNSLRRRVLVKATALLGAIGAGFAATPFLLSMGPSARARALGGPVEVDISKLGMGEMTTLAWRGKPIWVVRRSSETLARLDVTSDLLVDPRSSVLTQQPPYSRNIHRSINPEVFVGVGLCTHLGCVPLKRFVVGAASGLGERWPGGFYCPCHGSMFDMAGRVFKDVPAPTNLVIPPHRYLSSNRIEIGVDAVSAS